MTDILKIKKWIDEAEYIIIGAGAGLSDAAGIHYAGDKFNHDFIDYIRKYGITDLYTSSFYPFKSEEERWAYWAKHIYFSYYETRKTELYQDLLSLVKNKNYFIITTNCDGQFLHNDFLENRIFEVQGSYSKLQCARACHDKLYDDEEFVYEMMNQTDEDLKIPSYLVPKCPVCGGKMNVHLRVDSYFVEDDQWHQEEEAYNQFLEEADGKKILFLEFVIGFNTPGIIRFPFEHMTFVNPQARLIRFNKEYPNVPKEIKSKALEVSDDIKEVLKLVKKLM